MVYVIYNNLPNAPRPRGRVVGKIPYEISSDVIKYVETFDPNAIFADCGLPSPHVDILIGVEFVNRMLTGNKRFIGELGNLLGLQQVPQESRRQRSTMLPS